MEQNNCPHCGMPLAPGAVKCYFCGVPVRNSAPPRQPGGSYSQQPPRGYGGYGPGGYGYPQPPVPPYCAPGVNPAWPLKSKIAAGLLAILLGGLGVHKFYMGQIGLGLVYLLFSWTGIPSIIGLVEGIIYLTMDDYTFQMKYQVRIV